MLVSWAVDNARSITATVSFSDVISVDIIAALVSLNEARNLDEDKG